MNVNRGIFLPSWFSSRFVLRSSIFTALTCNYPEIGTSAWRNKVHEGCENGQWGATLSFRDAENVIEEKWSLNRQLLSCRYCTGSICQRILSTVGQICKCAECNMGRIKRDCLFTGQQAWTASSHGRSCTWKWLNYPNFWRSGLEVCLNFFKGISICVHSNKS